MASTPKAKNTLFGLRIHDDGEEELVYIDDIPKEDYGKRCGLVCSGCGSPLEAVRHNKGDVEGGFKFLRHGKNKDRECSGVGESAIHKLAKNALVEAIGQEMMLPEIKLSAAIPHTSFLSTSGGEGHAYSEFIEDYQMEFADKIVPRPATSAKIVAVDEESTDSDCVPRGRIADAVVTFEMPNGSLHKLAIEFRYQHAKEYGDVLAYSSCGFSVLEILLGDLDTEDRSFLDALRDRVLGRGDDSGFGREWLYNRVADERYGGRLVWKVSGCYAEDGYETDDFLGKVISSRLREMGLAHLDNIPLGRDVISANGKWLATGETFRVKWAQANSANGGHMESSGKVELSLYHDDDWKWSKPCDGGIPMGNVGRRIESQKDVRWIVEEIARRTYESCA